MNITPCKWVSKCRLPQNYMYTYIKYIYMFIIIQSCPQFLLTFHRTHCESLCKTTGLVLGSNFLDLFNQMMGSSTVITCNYIMYVSLANKPHHRRTQQELQQELPASVRSTLHPPLSDKICKSWRNKLKECSRWMKGHAVHTAKQWRWFAT